MKKELKTEKWNEKSLKDETLLYIIENNFINFFYFDFIYKTLKISFSLIFYHWIIGICGALFINKQIIAIILNYKLQ